VHRRDARNEAFERRGVELVVADMFDPDQVFDALDGVRRAYYLPFFHTHMIQSVVAFALAAKQAKLESIVHLGQWLSHRAHPAIMTRQTWLADHLFADLPGIAHTTLNPGMSMALCLLLCAWAAWLARPLPLIGPVAFVLFISRFQIVPEEPALIVKFGDVYADYRRSARRWL
jgi:uncharacterized protein YbjT (DUF2867 family)